MLPYELKETLVTIDNVSLKFGDKIILKSTTAEVKDLVRPDCIQGQVVGILGPSGIGKTQFSMILAGLRTPTTGIVKVDRGKGLELAAAGSVGVVFQNYRLFEWRTVLGNLLVAQENSGLSPQERKNKATDFLTKFELADKADYYPASLSGGQRQRVAIIQALLSSGNYLIMDEPFTGLDPLMKDKVAELINKVSEMDERNTIFVVAHDISALVSISDTLWLFGRDRDTNGLPIPGATIKKQYDLVERDLAWHRGISSTSKFHDFVNEVKEQFKTL